MGCSRKDPHSGDTNHYDDMGRLRGYSRYDPVYDSVDHYDASGHHEGYSTYDPIYGTVEHHDGNLVGYGGRNTHRWATHEQQEAWKRRREKRQRRMSVASFAALLTLTLGAIGITLSALLAANGSAGEPVSPFVRLCAFSVIPLVIATFMNVPDKRQGSG